MQSQMKKRIGFAAVLLLLTVAVLSAMTVRADAPDGYHEIITEVSGGDSSCKITWTGTGDIRDGKYCQDGSPITVTATAGPGYELDYLVRKDSSGERTLPPGQATATENAVTEDLTFIAHFKAKVYNVVYVANQSDVSITTASPLPATYAYGADAFELYIPSDTPAYAFVGWYEGDNAIKMGSDGKYWYKPSTVPAGSEIRLVAHFEPREIGGYRVDMDWLTKKRISPDPIEYTNWKYRDEISSDETLMDPDGTFRQYPGYTFVVGNAQYYEKKSISATKKLNEIIRYYVPNVYTVTFDACGGTFADSDSTVQVTFNQKIADIAAGKLPTREGYTFAGFYSERDGRGARYIDGTGAGSTWNLPSDTTLYAYWVAKTYSVDFDADLAANAVITVKQGSASFVYDGTPLSFPFGTVLNVTVTVKEGYKLVSWNGDALAHTRERTFPFTVPAENTTLTGVVLPVCTVPAFRVDYVNEILTAPGGIPSGSYVLRFGDTDYSFTGDGAPFSVSNYFGSTVHILCRGDGVTTADSEWLDLVLAARPAKPGYGEGGMVEKPSTTENSVSFTVSDADTVDYEFAYSLRTTDKLVWRDSGLFTDLRPGTTYTFYIRVKATENAPHGEEFSMTVYTLNEDYLKGEIEKLRGNMQEGDGKNVSDLITIYVTKMEALQPSANYQEELQELINECLAKLALARYKDREIARIDARCEELLAGNLYNEDGKATLESLRTEATAAINGAATTAGVDNARRDFDAKVAEIPVRIDLTWMFATLGVVIFLQAVVLTVLVTRRVKYADQVKYARGKAIYGLALPVYALSAQFLPEKSALVALLLGVLALVLQIIIMVLIFRSVAILKKPKKTKAQPAQEDRNPEPQNGQTPPATDAFSYGQPQMSVFHDDDAPTFENDPQADELQEEDWYDETPADDDGPTVRTFSADDDSDSDNRRD